MLREIYPYYDRELSFMRDMAGEFARNYPHVAARLDLERHRCDDPHVERLIEAFCLIAARIHHRLDADSPEITQALLNLIYPHYLRPTPSMSIMQFRLAKSEADRADRVQISKDTEIEIGDDLCKFQTCYPVDLWPVEIKSGAVLDGPFLPEWSRRFNPSSGILIDLSSGQPFSGLKDFETLRFYLSGTGHVPFTLYELILKNCRQVLLRDPDTNQSPITLSRDALRGVGFSTEESVLPYDRRSFLGFRLLHEYFCFPNKFLFFDVTGLRRVQEAKVGKRLQLLFVLDSDTRRTEEFTSLRTTVSADNFLLGCSPAVNLFSHTAEQIRLDRLQSEYQVIPDNDRAKSLEVYSVDRVSGRAQGQWGRREYQPFFSFGRGDPGGSTGAFWNSTRRASSKNAGTEVFLSIVDPKLQATEPIDDLIEVEVTCTNRDLPSELAFPLTFGMLGLSDNRVLSRFVHRPTRTLSPPVERDLDWRVISMLGLNYLSLTNADEPETSSTPEALHALLALYNFSDDPAIAKRIHSLTSVNSYPIRARIAFRRGAESIPVFCHGTAVEIEVAAESLGGAGSFLFF
jgi:type VI secretion system protein ImpG